MSEPVSDLSQIPGMDAESIAERQRQLDEQLRDKGIEPLTRERLREIGTGGPWESDEEFEQYMAFIYAQRGRSPE